MKYALLLLMTLQLLGGCANTTQPQKQVPSKVEAADEKNLRNLLSAIRDNPSEASPELIQDLRLALKALRDAKQVNKKTATNTAAATRVVQEPLVREAEQAVASVVLKATPTMSAGSIYTSAVMAEEDDKLRQALVLYRHASSLGSAKASKRLMEIYTNGMTGVPRNYVVAVRYKNLALQQGAYIDEKYAQ